MLDYGIGVVLVPVQSVTVPLVSVVPGGQTNTPPTGPITTTPAFAMEAPTCGEQPLPSHAASKSTVRRLVPTLPNISLMTQFWLGRGVPRAVWPETMTPPGRVTE